MDPKNAMESDLYRHLQAKESFEKKELNRLFNKYGVSHADRSRVRQLSCSVRTLKKLKEAESTVRK